jgi:hypothetical protein
LRCEIGESPLERHCVLEATCTCLPAPANRAFRVTYGIALIGRCRWAERSLIRRSGPRSWCDNARTGFWRSLFRCQGAARGTRRLVTDLPHPDLAAGSGPVSPPLQAGAASSAAALVFRFNRLHGTGSPMESRTGGGR